MWYNKDVSLKAKKIITNNQKSSNEPGSIFNYDRWRANVIVWTTISFVKKLSVLKIKVMNIAPINKINRIFFLLS